MKKRITAFLMSLFMLFSVMQPVQATEESASITAGSASAYAGDTVTIAVLGNNFNALGSLDLEIYYDDSAMTLNSTSNGSLWKDALLDVNKKTAGVIKVSAVSLAGITGSGTLLNLSFTLGTDIETGEYPIGVAVGDAYDVDLNESYISGSSGKITVSPKEAEQKTFNIYTSANPATVSKGDSLTLNIYNWSYRNFASGNFIIEYDAELFEVEDVRLHSNLMTADAIYDVNTNILGCIRVSYAANQETSSYYLMEVDLKAVADMDTTTNLTVTAKDVYTESLSEYKGYSYSRKVTFAKLPEEIKYPELRLDVQDMIVGEEYTTTLHLEEGAAIGAADFALAYDTSVFECISVEAAEDVADQGGMVMINPAFNKGNIKFSYINQSGYAEGLDLVDITWRVLSAPSEHYTITSTGTGVKTTDYQDVQLEYVENSSCIYDMEITQPTCTEQGYTTYACSCQKSYKENYVAALGHTEVTDEAVEATCTESGLTEGKHCSVCKEVLQKQEEVTAKGHAYKDVVTAPTCTEEGYTTHTCIRCNDVVVDTKTEALGHTEVIDEAVEATCTESGLTEGKHCSVCKEVLLKQEEVAAQGHVYKDVVTAPTCTLEGYTTHTCSRCNDVVVDTKTEATGHSYQTNWSSDATSHYHACENCDDVKDTAEHIFKWKIDKEATTTKDGLMHEECTICGKVENTTIIAYPKEVKLSETTYTYTGKTKSPKVTVTDSKGKRIASSNYTVSYSNNKEIGTAKVTIKFKSNYKGTITKTFTIKPKTASLSKVTAKSKGFTAKWKEASKISGYQIQYSTSKKFTKAKSVTLSKNKVSYSKSKLSGKKTYYVRIRTYKTVSGKKYYSEWSSAKKVTTKK